jgi:hypothetical protein
MSIIKFRFKNIVLPYLRALLILVIIHAILYYLLFEMIFTNTGEGIYGIALSVILSAIFLFLHFKPFLKGKKLRPKTDRFKMYMVLLIFACLLLSANSALIKSLSQKIIIVESPDFLPSENDTDVDKVIIKNFELDTAYIGQNYWFERHRKRRGRSYRTIEIVLAMPLKVKTKYSFRKFLFWSCNIKSERIDDGSLSKNEIKLLLEGHKDSFLYRIKDIKAFKLLKQNSPDPRYLSAIFEGMGDTENDNVNKRTPILLEPVLRTNSEIIRLNIYLVLGAALFNILGLFYLASQFKLKTDKSNNSFDFIKS